jgi:thymidylate kinase
MLIAFEGPDGAGKSTLIKQLYATLVQERELFKPQYRWAHEVGHSMAMVREPYDSHLGTYLKVVTTERDLSPLAYTLAFTAARRELYDDLAADEAVADVNGPDSLVLSDRSYLSTIVYQGMVAQQLSAKEAVDAYLPLHQLAKLPHPNAFLVLFSQSPLGTMDTAHGMNLMQGKRHAYIQAYREASKELAARGLVQHVAYLCTDFPGVSACGWALDQIGRVFEAKHPPR